MANYMADVAKLLGVELNEIFEYETLPGIPFKLTETGLVCLGPAKMKRDVMDEALVRILTGCSKIKYKPWKPKMNDTYWFVGTDESAGRRNFNGCPLDMYNYKLGNCYRTEEAAIANRDKWYSFYASDEVLEI